MQPTIQSLLANAIGILEAQSIPEPQFNAELLLAFVLQQSRAHLVAWPEKIVTKEQCEHYIQYVKRAAEGEPIAYITRSREFWSLSLQVTRDTLIPRPETELLVETILQLFPANISIRVADLGTGSGAIACALAHERPLWRIDATDQSVKALQIASINAQQLKLTNISFYCGNWCTALPAKDFDVIVSNPPYITEKEWPMVASKLAFEPKAALVSGEDGLMAIREIVNSAVTYLRPGGYLWLEHGYHQGALVRELLAQAGFEGIQTEQDLAGCERVSGGRVKFSAFF